VAVLAATILPLALISFALAQPFRPPQMPRPPIGPFGPGGFGGLGQSRTYTCPKCGTKQTVTKALDDHDPEVHCGKCGFRLDAPERNAPPKQQPDQDPNPNGRGEPRIPNQGPFNPNPAPNPAPNNPPPQQNPFLDVGGQSNSSPAKSNAAPMAKSSTSIWVLIILIAGGLLLLLAIAGVGAVIWMVQTTPSPGARSERRPRRPVRYDPV
jgi:DNA-directed RNA polymerase subunit RPC12/RpoP